MEIQLTNAMSQIILEKPLVAQLLHKFPQSIELVLSPGTSTKHKMGYINQAQHKPSMRVKTNIKNIKANWAQIYRNTTIIKSIVTCWVYNATSNFTSY
jgi:hypothetical protein